MGRGAKDYRRCYSTLVKPWFNIEWSAQQFAAGKKNMWSCYRKLFGGTGV